MSLKVDGRKVVAFAVAGMCTMVGVSTIWLPFISDRDKIRGMAEDENMTEDERFKMMREMSLQMSQERAAQQQGSSPLQRRQSLQESGLQGEKSNKSSGSMWKNITQARDR